MKAHARFCSPRMGLLAVASACLAGAVLLTGCSAGAKAAQGSSSAGTGSAQDVGYYGLMPEPPVSMPNITLTDTSGQPYNLKSETAGDVTLLYTGYTHCADVCHATMAELAGVLKQLPAKVAPHVKVIFVTVDPNRDTATVIRKWLDQFSTNLIGLRAPASTVATLEKELELPLSYDQPSGKPGDYGVEHSAVVFGFGEDGIAHLEYPQGVTIADYVHDVTSLAEHGFQAPPTGAGTAG